MILQVLREVKSREEEYEFVKSITSNIECLPPSHQLARRERRLLWNGPVSFNIHRTSHHTDLPRTQTGTTASTTQNQTDPSSRQRAQRSSRLFDAIGGKGNQRRYIVSSSSSSSFPSSGSFDTTSSCPTSASGIYPRPGNQTPKIVVERCSSEDLTNLSTNGTKYPPSARSTAQILVFVDVIILTTISRGSRTSLRDTEGKWRLLEGCGVSKLFGVTENGQYSEDLL